MDDPRLNAVHAMAGLTARSALPWRGGAGRSHGAGGGIAGGHGAPGARLAIGHGAACAFAWYAVRDRANGCIARGEGGVPGIGLIRRRAGRNAQGDDRDGKEFLHFTLLFWHGGNRSWARLFPRTGIE